MPENAMTDGQYRELRGKLTEIQETLDGRGREPGLKQEVRELRHLLEGRPPTYDDGVKADVRQLRTNVAVLRTDFDRYVDDQEKQSDIGHGKRSGLSELWKVILSVVGFLATAVGLYIAVRQAVTSALGGG